MVEYRYFLCTNSPLNEQIAGLNAQRRKAIAAVLEFAKKFGIEKAYGDHPRNYSFDIAAPGPAWSKVRGYAARYGGQYRPRQNTPEGRELRALVDALPSIPNGREFGRGVVPGFGAMCYADRCMYHDYVAWYDSTHAVAAMLTQDTEVNADSPVDRVIDVQPWMREIKKWEFERLKDTGELPD